MHTIYLLNLDLNPKASKRPYGPHYAQKRVYDPTYFHFQLIMSTLTVSKIYSFF